MVFIAFAAISAVMAGALGATGYDLVHIDPTSADEVIEAVDEFRPDCVLLDLYLRGFSGRRAYEQFKSHPAFDHTPVIIVSAMIHERDNWVLRPIDGFVPKPFHIGELEQVVSEKIELSRAEACSTRDPWWGFKPPEELHARITEAIPEAWRGGEPITLGVVQLRDRASLVRRTGEMAADFVLRELAYRLSTSLPHGLIARQGPSELAVLLPGCSSTEAGEELATAIEAAGTEITLPGGTEVTVSVAAGVAGCPDHAASADQLWMAADIALAEAIEAGVTLGIAH